MGQRAAGKPLQGRCERFHQAALNVGLVEADLAALDQVPQFAAARTVVNERHRPPAKRRPVHRAVFDDLHTPLMLALRMTASVTMRSGSPGLQISANSGRLGSRRSSTVEALADGVSRSGSGCAGSMRKRSRSMAGGPPVCGASACWGGGEPLGGLQRGHGGGLGRCQDIPGRLSGGLRRHGPGPGLFLPGFGGNGHVTASWWRSALGGVACGHVKFVGGPTQPAREAAPVACSKSLQTRNNFLRSTGRGR